MPNWYLYWFFVSLIVNAPLSVSSFLVSSLQCLLFCKWCSFNIVVTAAVGMYVCEFLSSFPTCSSVDDERLSFLVESSIYVEFEPFKHIPICYHFSGSIKGCAHQSTIHFTASTPVLCAVSLSLSHSLRVFPLYRKAYRCVKLAWWGNHMRNMLKTVVHSNGKYFAILSPPLVCNQKNK